MCKNMQDSWINSTRHLPPGILTMSSLQPNCLIIPLGNSTCHDSDATIYLGKTWCIYFGSVYATVDCRYNVVIHWRDRLKQGASTWKVYPTTPLFRLWGPKCHSQFLVKTMFLALFLHFVVIIVNNNTVRWKNKIKPIQECILTDFQVLSFFFSHMRR